MHDGIHSDYRYELERQRTAWDRKPSLRALYYRWYERITAALSPLGPTVEIGAGCGNFKSYFPEVIATDVVRTGEWIDRIVDAQALPFREHEIGNMVLIDVLHHLSRPLHFLSAAERILKPGGRIVMLEPAGTPFARLIWRYFHHERFDLSQDLFGDMGRSMSGSEDLTFSNMAIATLLFGQNLRRTFDRLPWIKLARLEYSDFLVWPATGGFSYAGYVPSHVVSVLHRCEGLLTFPFASWLTGLRMLVVLEKNGRRTARSNGTQPSYCV